MNGPPPWPFNDPVGLVAVTVLLAGAWGWLGDRARAWRRRCRGAPAARRAREAAMRRGSSPAARGPQ